MNNEYPIVVQCKKVSKSFNEGNLGVDVLKEINFIVRKGEQVAIVGVSGSGKSTLLHMLGGLTKPSKGQITVNGQEINKLSQAARGRLRNKTLGFVYQFHHLLPEFTALENVAMPQLIRKKDSQKAFEDAAMILDLVGLKNRLHHKPGELSGGERQRAAVARAMVTKPHCIMADEPTGNLDGKTAESIYTLMLEFNVEFNTSLVIVTHDIYLADKMQRIVKIENGMITEK